MREKEWCKSFRGKERHIMGNGKQSGSKIKWKKKRSDRNGYYEENRSKSDSSHQFFSVELTGNGREKGRWDGVEATLAAAASAAAAAAAASQICYILRPWILLRI